MELWRGDRQWAEDHIRGKSREYPRQERRAKLGGDQFENARRAFGELNNLRLEAGLAA